MKNSIALLCFALCTAAGPAAQAADGGDAFCKQLASDIAVQGALFLKVAAAAPITQSSTAAVLQGVHDKNLALSSIANEIWSLRTRMAYLDCAQAKAFAY